MTRLRVTCAAVTLTAAATLGTVALANAATLAITDATLTGTPTAPAAPAPSGLIVVTVR